MKYFILFSLLVCITNNAYPQDEITTYNGRVVDKQSKNPIPDVFIYVKNGSVTNITNASGDFLIRLPQKLQSDTLILSHIGYATLEIPLIEFNKWNGIFPMPASNLELQEIEISAERITADDIMKKMAQSRKKNFTSDFFEMEGYYKHRLTMDDKEIGFIEVALDLMDQDYQPYKYRNGIAQENVILKGIRKNINRPNLYRSALKSLESNDYLNNMLIINRARRGFRGLQYQLDTTINYGNKLVHVIEATLDDRKPEESFWKIKIFINADDYAIQRVESRMETAKYGIKIFDKSVNDTLVNRPMELNRFFEFRKMGDYYYPVYYRVYGKERLDDVENFTSQVYEYDNELLLFNLNTDNTGHDKQKRLKVNRIDDRFNELDFDSTFWSNYNHKLLIDEDISLEFTDESFSENELEYFGGSRDSGYQFTRLDTLQGTLTPLRTSYDVGFYHLDVEVMPEEELIKGSSLIRFKVLEPVDRIQIDLYSQMEIEKIEWRGQLLSFEREYNAVYINFPEILGKGEIEEVKVFYSGRPVDYDLNIPMYASFLWFEDDEGDPWLQAICQGYGASGWWPNKDHLSDEPDSARISVTAPEALDVVSNGRLLEKKELVGDKNRWDWAVSYPINNYNVTFNIGKYKKSTDVYDNGISKLDLGYYLLEENDTDVSVTMAVVKPMLKTFEKYFGPYPFPKDGFKLVESPHPMEHQSCVAIGSDYFYDADDSGIWAD
ncbi:MAG: carboxypeptidase-like regulatory domain-containing protein, partial [Bacteroidota bacterium]